MNSRTARLLNKVASKTNGNSKELKRKWNALPKPERAKERLRLQRQIKTA